jgi:YidC/Oxa1 family membrane protein insertase
MDKNTVIGLVLIAGLLIAYSLFTRPSREEQAEMQRIRDSIEQAQEQTLLEQQQQAQEPQAIAPPAQAAEDEPPAAEVETQPDPESYADLYGSFAEGATGTQEFITLENEEVRLVVSTLGGRPYSVELKEHQTHDGQPLVLVDGDSTVFGLTLSFSDSSFTVGNWSPGFTRLLAMANFTWFSICRYAATLLLILMSMSMAFSSTADLFWQSELSTGGPRKPHLCPSHLAQLAA